MSEPTLKQFETWLMSDTRQFPEFIGRILFLIVVFKDSLKPDPKDDDSETEGGKVAYLRSVQCTHDEDKFCFACIPVSPPIKR